MLVAVRRLFVVWSVTTFLLRSRTIMKREAKRWKAIRQCHSVDCVDKMAALSSGSWVASVAGRTKAHKMKNIPSWFTMSPSSEISPN